MKETEKTKDLEPVNRYENNRGYRLLLSAKEAADLLGVSRAHFYSLYAAGKIPLAIRLGYRVLWGRKELDYWVSDGCPTREKWEQIKKMSLVFERKTGIEKTETPSLEGADINA